MFVTAIFANDNFVNFANVKGYLHWGQKCQTHTHTHTHTQREREREKEREQIASLASALSASTIHEW